MSKNDLEKCINDLENILKINRERLTLEEIKLGENSIETLKKELLKKGSINLADITAVVFKLSRYINLLDLLKDFLGIDLDYDPPQDDYDNETDSSEPEEIA